MEPSSEELTCAFCEGHADIIVPEIGIAWGMKGYDYSFCKACLSSMTALEFWQRLADKEGCDWPLKSTTS